MERQPLLDEASVAQNQSPNWTESTISEDTTSILGDGSSSFSRLKLAAVMFNFWISGIGMSAVGVLLPRIENYYDTSDGKTAFIFPSGVTGYFCAIVAMQSMHAYFGRRGLAISSPILRFIALSILASGSPFFITLIGYFFIGLGTGLTDAGFCAWASNVPSANIVQGFMHGSFSLGAILGPLVATAVLNRGLEWYIFYRILILFIVVELFALAFAFRHDSASVYDKEVALSRGTKPSNPLRMKATWVACAFLLAYVGFEAVLTDWIVVYMRRIRHNERTTASLASSIFWAGMAIGRLGLGPITQHFGVEKSVVVYIISVICLQVLFRFLRGLTISLILLALTGCFCGPLFPSGVILLASKLPAYAHVGAIAAASMMGQVGAGVFPLALGFVADRFGIQHLLDVMIVLIVAMLAAWLYFARMKKMVLIDDAET